MSFDGYEALTPPPQGDVPVEDIARALGDSGKLLIDGIPATLFLREFKESKLEERQAFVEPWIYAANRLAGCSGACLTGST